MARKYHIGTIVKLFAPFTHPTTGAAVDPDTVVFKIQDPDSTESTYTYGDDAEVVKVSTGIYLLEIEATIAGTWYYRAEGTGTYQAADEQTFEVRTSQF